MADQEVKVKITTDASGAVNGFKILRDEAEKTEKSTQTVTAQMKSHWMAATAAVAAAAVGMSQAWDMIKSGAEYDEQHDILDNLSKKYSQTAESIVQSMQGASEGLIARADLMKIALGGIAKGLTPDQLTNLSDAAKILADTVGVSTTTALKDLSEALESGRAKALKGYAGATLDLEDSFGKLVSQMTAAEKVQAMYSMVMIHTTKLQKEQAKAVNEAADKIERMEAAWSNMVTATSRTTKDWAVNIDEFLGKYIFGPLESFDQSLKDKFHNRITIDNILFTPGKNEDPLEAYKKQIAELRKMLQLRADDADSANKQAKAMEDAERAALRLQERWQQTSIELQTKIQTTGMDEFESALYKAAADAEKLRREFEKLPAAIKPVAMGLINKGEQIDIDDYIKKLEKTGAASYEARVSEMLEEYNRLRTQYELFAKQNAYNGMEEFERESQIIKDTEQEKYDYIQKLLKAKIVTHEEAENAILKVTRERIKSEMALTAEKYMRENESMQGVAQATSDMFSMAANLYAEDSKERQKLSDLSKAATVAEIALQTQKNLMIAVGAVVNQGTGDPYTAFARIAAMIGVVTGVLSIAGIAFSGGSASGGSSATSHPVMGNSTVLGAEYGTGSESLANSLAILEDTYDLEDTKLTKIYNELKDLNGNITGLVTAYIRTGGNMTADDFGVALGSTMGGMQVGSENFRNWMEKGGFFNMGAWFDSEDSITQFIQAFHQADIVGTWINKEIGRIIGDLFGGGQETWSTGTGIALGRSTVGGLLSGGGAGARGYADITKRTSTEFWRDDSYDYETLYRDLDSNVTRMFDQVYQGLGATLLELAKQFGTDTQAALNYAFEEAKINLADMTGEEMNKALQEYISKIGDEATEALFGDIIGKYQQLNEGMLETATRLVMDKNIVESMLGLTNQGLRAESVAVMKSREVLNDEWVKWNEKQGVSKYISMMVDVISEPSKYLTETYVEMELGTSRVIEFTESLIEMAGGLEKLTDAFNTYYDSFFSDKEKQQDLKMQLQGALGGYGYNLPGTRSGYRAIVEGLDINTSSGLEAYNTLLQLSKSADAYYDYIEQSRGGMRETDYASRADYMRAMRGYADGGMSYGPESGYMAMLHGPELIVSPKKGYPATVVGGSDSPELLAEIKGLRADMRERSYRSQELMRRLNLTIENWDGNGIPAERAA